MHSNFEPGRVFANHLDFQDNLDGWTDRVNQRVHRTIKAVPAERLAEEKTRMRRRGALLAACARGLAFRVAGSARFTQ
jgi:hypothetical protein